MFLKASPLMSLQCLSSCPYTLYTLCKGSFLMHLRRRTTAAVPWWGTTQSSQAYIPSEEVFLNQLHQLQCKMISLPVGHDISYGGSEGKKRICFKCLLFSVSLGKGNIYQKCKCFYKCKSIPSMVAAWYSMPTPQFRVQLETQPLLP